MTHARIYPGDISEAAAIGGDACTVSIVRDSSASWLVEITAHFEGGGSHVAGVVRTCPASVSGAPQSRVIAAAALPGARSWSVRAYCLGEVRAQKLDIEAVMALSGFATGTPIEIEVCAAAMMGAPGFGDLEVRTSEIVSGVDGYLTLGRGQRLVSWVAQAGADPAQLSVNGQAVTIPAYQTVAVDLQSRNVWTARIRAIGTTNYVVEVEG